jgi:hypothetical protein
MYLGKWTKSWIVIIQSALLAYDLYWVNSLFNLLGPIFSGPMENVLIRYPGFYTDYLPTTFGAVLRLTAVLLGFFALLLLWGHRAKSFFDVRNMWR